MCAETLQRAGSVLLAVVILIATLSTLLAISLVSANHYRRMVQGSVESLKLYYAVQSALEKNYADLNLLISGQSDIPGNLGASMLTSNINTDTLPDFLMLHASSFRFEINTVVPTDISGSPINAPRDENPDPYVEDYFFLSAAYAESSRLGRTIRVELEQPLKYSIRPLFYFGAFFNGNLEIYPDSNMKISGKVHANRDIYFGSPNGSAIHFDNHVSSVGGVHNDYHPRYPEVMTPIATNTHSFTQKPHSTAAELIMGGKAFDQEDDNPNNDSPRELIEMPVHVLNNKAHDDPFSEDRLYNQAGLKIIVSRESGKIDFRTADGTSITPANASLYKLLTNTFQIASPIPDSRMDKSVPVLSVNMSNLLGSQNAPLLPPVLASGSKWPSTTVTRSVSVHSQQIISDNSLNQKTFWNGMIYVGFQDSTVDLPAGVLLINGQNLPEGGVSVITPNALYVQGDYNTGASGQQVPSNSDTALSEMSSDSFAINYTKKPAALFADTITVLSLNYNKSINISAQNRTAAATTVNAAIVSGQTFSTIEYPEGLEQFIKFLENWSGKTLTISGSFASLYNTQEGLSKEGYHFNLSPYRSWRHEDSYMNGKLPPGTPYVKTLKKGPVQRVY